MIGQLQNNFRKILASATLVAAMSVSSYSFAETVVGRLIASDWFIIVKEEGGVKTVVHTHEPPDWKLSEPVYFDVNFTNETLDNSYLYILAASRPGGQEGLLGGQLNGDKKITSGSSAITALNSNWTDASLPNLEVIKEITSGDLGGVFGPTRQAKAIGEFSYGSTKHNSDVPGIWSQQSGNDGSVVAFRIPYTALFDIIADKNPDTESSGSGTGESTVTPNDDKPSDDIEKMEDYIAGLIEVIKDHEANIRDLEVELTKEKNRADSTFELLKDRDAAISSLQNTPTATVTLEKLEEQKKEIAALKAEIHELRTSTNPNPMMSFLGGSGLLGLGGLIGFLMGRRGSRNNKAPQAQHHQQEPKSEDRRKPSFPVHIIRQTADGFTTEIKSYPTEMEKYDSDKNGFGFIEPSGFVFPRNPFETLDKNKQTTMSAPWETAYKATGRVGMAQMGVPIGKDDCLGTCILISPNYIITNRHVFETHYDRIMEPEELIGVEFFGELESAETEFHKISNQEVYILEDRDAVILKLETAVDQNHRPYIKFSNKPPETYVDDDIIVIGYPVELSREDLTDAQLQVFEDIEIYRVKRFSTGKVFSHQYDTNGDFIVETKTSGEYSPDERQPAISYDASTLPGNSGSPVVSKNTGDVIGLHFGDGRFDEQPANVGHSGQILAGFVTYVTSGQAKNMTEIV